MRGTLHGAQVRTLRFELRVDDELSYSGTIADDAVPHVEHATINDVYAAQIRETHRPGDTMVIDSVVGHGRTADAITAFVASGDRVAEIGAAGICHFCPDRPILRALRLVKSQGLLKVEELDDVLQVSGRPDLLAEYAKEFRFDPSRDGTHAHPEHRLAFANQVDPTSIFTILEIDNRADDPAGWTKEFCDEP